jgi:hypothetical protein
VYLALVMINKHRVNVWTSALREHSGYTVADLKKCITMIHTMAVNPKPAFDAVRKKYSKSKLNAVARIPVPATIF